MEESVSPGANLSFRTGMLIILMLIYFLAVVASAIMKNPFVSVGMLFFLGFIWFTQLLSVGDDPDVAARASMMTAIFQAIGIGFHFIWMTANWLAIPFWAFGIPDDFSGEDLAVYFFAGIGGAGVSYLANRNMGRYMFTAVFTLVAYLGMVTAVLNVLFDGMVEDSLDSPSGAGIYILVIPVWSVAPIAYLIRYYKQYRSYRKALFEPDFILNSVRTAKGENTMKGRMK